MSVKTGSKNSFGYKIVETFKSLVLNFEDLSTYGPTVDATVLETLQAFDEVLHNETQSQFQSPTKEQPSQENLMRTEFPSKTRLTSVSTDTENTTQDIQQCNQKAFESPSAISLMQGSPHSPEANSIPLSQQSTQSFVQKGTLAEEVKSMISNISEGSEKKEFTTCLSPTKNGNPGSITNSISYELESKPDSQLISESKNLTSEGGNLLGTRNAGKKKLKIMQTLWGVTRINIYNDCSKTFEILGASPREPSHVPKDLLEVFAIGPINKYK